MRVRARYPIGRDDGIAASLEEGSRGQRGVDGKRGNGALNSGLRLCEKCGSDAFSLPVSCNKKAVDKAGLRFAVDKTRKRSVVVDSHKCNFSGEGVEPHVGRHIFFAQPGGDFFFGIVAAVDGFDGMAEKRERGLGVGSGKRTDSHGLKRKRSEETLPFCENPKEKMITSDEPE